MRKIRDVLSTVAKSCFDKNDSETENMSSVTYE
jgi:hypothetical protein